MQIVLPLGYVLHAARMWRQLPSPREPGRTEFPSGLALLWICISVLMVFSCKKEVLKGGFSTWDKLKPRYQWVWGPIIPLLSQEGTALAHINSCARTKLLEVTVLVSARQKSWDMRHSFGSAVTQGCIWRVKSALPWVEQLHWYYRLCKGYCSLGVPIFSWLIHKKTTRLKSPCWVLRMGQRL